MGLIFRTLLELQSDVLEIKHSINELKTNVEDVKFDLKTNQVTQVLDTAPASYDELLTENTIEDLERMMIEKSLIKYKHNKRTIAKVLGISERTLYRKIQDLGLE
jgi:DNA-binding NtrC family response regulator